MEPRSSLAVIQPERVEPEPWRGEASLGGLSVVVPRPMTLDARLLGYDSVGSSGRPEMTPQRLENVESAPGIVMAGHNSSPLYLAPGAAAAVLKTLGGSVLDLWTHA